MTKNEHIRYMMNRITGIQGFRKEFKLPHVNLPIRAYPIFLNESKIQILCNKKNAYSKKGTHTMLNKSLIIITV